MCPPDSLTIKDQNRIKNKISITLFNTEASISYGYEKNLRKLNLTMSKYIPI